MAGRSDPDHRHTRFGHRHVRVHGRPWHHLQHALAVRLGSGDRHRRGRCDRRGRERGALPAARPHTQRGSASHDGRGWGRPDRHRPGAMCGISADGVHRGAAGILLSPVRNHHCGFDAPVVFRLSHAVSCARCPAPTPAYRARGAAQWFCAVRADRGVAVDAVLPRLQPGLRVDVQHVWRTDQPSHSADRACLSGLCRADRPDRLALQRDPDRPHSGARPWLPDRRVQPAAGCNPSERTDAVVHAASEIIDAQRGVLHSVAFAGFDGATFTNAPNSAAIFADL